MSREALQLASQEGSEQDIEARIQIFEHGAELPAACRVLFDEGERASFDLGEDWFRLLRDTAIPADVRTCFYVLTRGMQARCVLPLRLMRRKVAGLTTFYSSLYRPLLAADLQVEELAALFRRVVRQTGAASLRFDAMDPAHPSYALTRNALGRAGLRPATFFSFGNWYLPVAGTFDAYFKSLGSKTQNTVKRRAKKFAASGGRLVLVTGGEGLDSAIEAWDRIYRSSWKRPEPYPAFMPGLIRLCATRHWLRLGVAYHNDVPIAAQLWIVSHGKAAIYKLAYDESYAPFSAGTLLTAHLMQHVFDVDRVREVDYLIGDDAYKKEWMNLRRERRGLIAYNPRSIRGIVGLGLQKLGAVRRRWRSAGVAGAAPGLQASE